MSKQPSLESLEDVPSKTFDLDTPEEIKFTSNSSSPSTDMVTPNQLSTTPSPPTEVSIWPTLGKKPESPVLPDEEDPEE